MGRRFSSVPSGRGVLWGRFPATLWLANFRLSLSGLKRARSPLYTGPQIFSRRPVEPKLQRRLSEAAFKGVVDLMERGSVTRSSFVKQSVF